MKIKQWFCFMIGNIGSTRIQHLSESSVGRLTDVFLLGVFFIFTLLTLNNFILLTIFKAPLDMEKLSVVFVDDDQSILDGLKRYLRRQSRVWNIRFYNDGQKALDDMGDLPPDLVVTDMRMPGMNGVELLTQVRERFPTTIRFILSGFSDREMILKSVGVTHQFFAKPVEAEILVEAIEFSNSLYTRINDPQIQNVICGISNLPVPSVTFDRINQELKGDDPSLHKVADIVMEDASISAKILQLVNSAFFGIGDNITDIGQATMFLGVDVLKYLVLSISIANDSFSHLSHRVDIDSLSSHSMRVAHLSWIIASELRLSKTQRHTAFAAGLLHDIGKLVMANYFLDSYYDEDEFRMQSIDSEYTQDLETKKFSVNHSDVGAGLLALWGLPPRIVNATAYHHKPHCDIQNKMKTSVIVHIANALAYKSKFENFENLLHSNLLNYEYVSSLGLIDQIKQWSLSDES